MSWRLKGYDTFSMESYALPGEYSDESEARDAAHARLEELERTQPTSSSGGQDWHGIQDKVLVVRPDGSSYRYLPHKPLLLR